MRALSATSASALGGTTIFLKQVKDPDKVKRLLQPASNNAKLGNIVRKGRWKGMPMHSLSLEERKTCPRSCQQWTTCYGNNMPFAYRIDHTSQGFIPALASEIQALAKKHATGFVVRLHVLGDFFSVPYVKFWIKQMKMFPQMQVFGYTHRDPKSPIGGAIEKLNAAGAWIRWSDLGDVEMAANVEGPGLTCPEQVGKTKSCSTCGLCWSVRLPIRFLAH